MSYNKIICSVHNLQTLQRYEKSLDLLCDFTIYAHFFTKNYFDIARRSPRYSFFWETQ